MAAMRQGQIIHIDEGLAVSAAIVSREEKLPMADSLILATARIHKATLFTQDADFENIPGVKYLKPQKRE